MPRTYQRKLLPNGEPNPRYKPDKRKRSRPYQAKLLADGTENPAYRKDTRSKSSLFDRGQFVAIDGEGANLPTGEHVYNMLAASDGTVISKPGGLSTVSCFDYLLRLRETNKSGIFVIFAGSYDANMWLCDLDKEDLQRINEADGKYFVHWNGYLIRYVPRKYFSLKREGDKKPIVIWDVHGFFQSSFIVAIKSWLPGHELTQQIIDGKAKRSQFTQDDYEDTLSYCRAELVCLVEMMNKLREGMRDLGLSISRWDGAGAVASAILKARRIKSAITHLPEKVQIAVEHGYFGGRIEIGKYGRHKGKIYHYDINSAYPSTQRHLPALSAGRWVHYPEGVDVTTNPNLLIISLVKWDLRGSTFYPFPYRSQLQNKVLFPSHGLNWIWKPELEAGLAELRKLNNFSGDIEIIESYVFEPDPVDGYYPFKWIDEYYNKRQTIVAESKRTGIPNGQEKVIKLGLNSLYGKTAQKVGYNERTGQKPPYHSLVYAGHITSATRAALWSAAMQADNSIIAMATDGIYSQVPLKLNCPKEKMLGEWEAQTHDEMILIQAGFYFYRDGNKWASYSRGFDKLIAHDDIIESKNNILEAWKGGKHELHLPCTRFITLKTALRGDWFDKWRTWYESETDGIKGRRLALSPEGTKREPVGTGRPHLKMVNTEPAYNLNDYDTLSSKYNLPWDDEINLTLIDIEHEETNA